MAKINMRGLKAEIAQKGYKIFKPLAEQRVKRALEKESQKLLNDFNNNEVTKEIEGGPSASNLSNTLGGYGNLFTFIGFQSGNDPISPIRSLLARSIKIKTIRKKRNVLALSLTFSVPTLDEIKAVAPSPWSTESWVEAVERGMSGLGQYLYDGGRGSFGSKSRSKSAIQIDYDIADRPGSSGSIDYISGILQRMTKNIEASLKRI